MPHSLDLSSTSGSEKCKLEFSALLADGTSRVNSELRVQYLLNDTIGSYVAAFVFFFIPQSQHGYHSDWQVQKETASQ